MLAGVWIPSEQVNIYQYGNLKPQKKKVNEFFFQKTMGRSYPFSEHDNQGSLQDNIDTYGQVSLVTLFNNKCINIE